MSGLGENKFFSSCQAFALRIVQNFRSRMLAFRGAGGEPPRRLRFCGVSPVPLVPQESSILPLQSAKCGFYSIIVQKQQSYRKEPLE